MSPQSERVLRMVECPHPPERLEKTFGLRRLPCCLDCGRCKCHVCLRIHVGPLGQPCVREAQS